MCKYIFNVDNPWHAAMVYQHDYTSKSKTNGWAESKTKNLLTVKLYENTKTYNVSLLNSTFSCKTKNILTDVKQNILKSDGNWFLNTCNNYLQETVNKKSIRFSVKSYNELKVTDVIVYIKCQYLKVQPTEQVCSSNF